MLNVATNLFCTCVSVLGYFLKAQEKNTEIIQSRNSQRAHSRQPYLFCTKKQWLKAF